MTLGVSITTYARNTTKARIMEALADVVLTDGVSGFSVQSVADRAGISHRTVYRHFPSREALLEGLTDYLDDWMRSEGLPGVPTTYEELIEATGPLYSFFGAQAPMSVAMVIVSLALGVEPERRERRTEGFIEMVRRESPNLTDDEARKWGLALRTVASSQSWYALTHRFQLSNQEAASVTSMSLRALIAEIRRHDSRQRSKEEY